MKSNVFAAVAAVAVVAVFIASVYLLGGYAAILFGSIIAAFLGGSADQDRRTATPNESGYPSTLKD